MFNADHHTLENVKIKIQNQVVDQILHYSNIIIKKNQYFRFKI